MQQLFLNAHKYSSLSVMQQPPLPVERGGDPTPLPGLPTPRSPAQGTPAPGAGSSLGGIRPHPHTGICSRVSPVLRELFPCGFLGLALSQPLPVPVRAQLPLCCCRSRCPVDAGYI